MESIWIIAAAALWGAGTGLLIPRAAYRLSVPHPEPWRTACPAGHPFIGAGNGWLGRARCADGEAVGPSTPAIAVVVSVVCAVLAAAVGDCPELVVWLVLVPFGVLLASVDFAVQRLPDVVTLPLAVITLGLLGVAALLPGTDGSWGSALVGSLTLSAFCLVLFLISPAGFGFGDVKLAVTLGAVTGWYGLDILIAGTFAGFVLFALYGLCLIVARRAGPKTAHPLGPFLLTGACVGVLLGSAV
ncbi:leader peptidase (prepilin peptidase)/N-methyltransferase [Streptomyces sp. SAI-208]|uniref:A24 family peptidase n=1 Tax=Streptomyces sp. SAI-208 TaxID=2940550 RepID=UPI002473E90D|nr:A24 family peptidase [Streptomyces sp. SAI-208]MDH6604537.1 leader peptidase (prepilin peptidase)/N-methyltransferase [Streptomyces sp. SAI-208]